MTFVCLEYLSMERCDALSEEERSALEHDSVAYDQELAEQGVLADAVLLAPDKTTVPADANIRENLVGYLIIRVDSLKEAQKIAERIPIVSYGRVEVRPVISSLS
ncbi:MAG: YciI family protein [Cyanobacteria bacterium J06627_8]